jgi:hypothetical protein
MKFKLHSPLQKFPASVFSFNCCAEIDGCLSLSEVAPFEEYAQGYKVWGEILVAYFAALCIPFQ